MSLHTKWLDFEFETTFHRSFKSPPLQQIIRNTKDNQIKQHQNQFHLSPQKALIRTTKKILNINRNKNNSNLSVTHFSGGLNDEQKYRTMTSIKNRRDQKLSLVKKHLQLLNEMNRSLQKNKIRRYQQQILLEQAEIEATIAQHKIKRNWMTATPKPNKIRIKRDSIKTPQIVPSEHNEQFQDKKHKASIDSDGQSIFDRLFPSRRFIQRKRSKGKVSPWHQSSPFY